MKTAPSAFTLIELLTVIAIIGILAAIIIPTVGKVRNSARAAQCVSNLRQINNAIHLYAQDNRERLPGPLWGGQIPRYNPATTTGQLSKLLAGYLPSTERSSTERTNDMFMCPGWVAAGGFELSEKRSFMVHIRPWGDSHGAWNFCPFGDINASEGHEKRQRRTLGELSQFPITRTWMLVDLDKELLDGTQNTASWKDGILPIPAHGSSRNVIFYDGHVERIPAAKLLPLL